MGNRYYQTPGIKNSCGRCRRVFTIYNTLSLYVRRRGYGLCLTCKRAYDRKNACRTMNRAKYKKQRDDKMRRNRKASRMHLIKARIKRIEFARACKLVS